jgi:hypothetical protein
MNPCVTTPGMQIVVRTFAAPGTYMPSPGLVTAVVETWGAGAGGGGAQPQTSAVIPTLGGGGGGSGGYSRKTLASALVLGGVIVTIGAGGVGGTVQGVNGGAGGSTSFGALCVANGGAGGVSAWSSSTAASAGYGGAPAAVGVGDLAFAGNAGETGGYALTNEEISVVGGRGGAAPAGGGVANVADTLGGTNVVANGPPGLSPGAGGGGGASANLAQNAVGGVGANGFCVVTEYCWANASGGGGSGCVNVPACPPGQWGYDG